MAFAEDHQIVERARVELKKAGAESVDAARDEWWIGLRDAEAEHYTKQGGDFNADQATYRLGFESALHPDCRGKDCEVMMEQLKKKHGATSDTPAFREGYTRGQHYLMAVVRTYKDNHGDEDKRKAA